MTDTEKLNLLKEEADKKLAELLRKFTSFGSTQEFFEIFELENDEPLNTKVD